jgi:hypothetical protein
MYRMTNKLNKIGLFTAAGLCALIVYLAWFFAINLLYDYFSNKEMFEAKLFIGSFQKPIGFMLIAPWLIIFGVLLNNAKAKKIGKYLLVLYFVVSVLPYGLSFITAPSNSKKIAIQDKSIKERLDLSKIDLCSFEDFDGTKQKECAVKLQPQTNKKERLDLSKIDLCSFENLDGTKQKGCAVKLQPQTNK